MTAALPREQSRSAAARADGGAAGVPLEELLTYKVCILAKMMERTSGAELGEKYALGVAEWRVLAQLSVMSPSTVRSLAARLRVDRAEVSRAAAGLIARRLVKRAPDPNDARSVLFTITERGRALYREIMPRRAALHERLMRVLAPAEAETFLAAVEKLTRFLDREEARAAGGNGSAQRPEGG